METSAKKRIYMSSPHLGGEEIRFVNNAFETNWIAPLGPNVDAFEKEVAEYVNLKGAAALSSGTAAIHLALRILGIKQGDLVFVSSFTFVASANPILYEKAEPVFIDSNFESWNMCPVALEKALEWALGKGKLPKAVIAVNLYGQSAEYDKIVPICKKYNVPLIEDAAESLGATYLGKPSGTFGDLSIFSFNGNKIITTSGGGMLLSNNIEYVNKARFLSTQARDPALHYQHSELGFNYRMSNVTAGIGRGQIRVLNERVLQRRAVFERYQSAFASNGEISFMPELSNSRSNRWLSACVINRRAKIAPIDVVSALDAENIESRPVWKPLHMQPLFEGTSFFSSSSMDVSKSIFEMGICLPSGSNLSQDDQHKIISLIKDLL